MIRRRVLYMGLLLSAVWFPAEAAAQTRQDSVLLHGRVIEEETETPIPFASLTLLDREDREIGRAQADARGRFTTIVEDQTGVTLVARRLGYRENRTPYLWFDRYQSFDLELRLDREVILLAPLEVVAREQPGSALLTDFEHRAERGMGWYFDREEIDRLRPALVTDLLQRVPGVRLATSGRGLRRVVELGRATGGACEAQVFIDGLHVNARAGQDFGGVAIDDYVSPGSLEGVEVYRGLATVPAEFLNEDAKCGVIVLWTRRGGRR